MAEMGYRDYLKGRGIKDDEITYDKGNIYAKGKYFGSATPREDGRTYGDVNALNQAYNQYNVSDLTDTVKANLSKPRAQFSYNVQADPLYQNALQAAQRSAQTAGNNASVRLGARGIGNSQQALTTENQIQQRSVADVNSNILPQLMSQAYSRYSDEQNREDARNRDILGLAGTYNNLGQQYEDNQYRTGQAAEQRKQNNWNAYLQSVGLTGDLGTGPKNTYQLLGDRSGNLSMAGQKYKDDLAQQSIENTYKTNAQAIQQQNANTSASNSARLGTKANETAAAKENKVSTAQFNDIYTTLQQRYGVAEYKDTGKKDKDGYPIYDTTAEVRYKNTTNPDQQVKMLTEILNAGLSDDQTLQLINKLGMTEEQARQLLGG